MDVVVKNKTIENSSRFEFSPSNNNNDDDDSSLRLGAHVLAVDDSLVDRKVIEKLLKITSCKVTAVDSGKRALQFLGLDGEEKQKQKQKEEEEERTGKEKEEERKTVEAEERKTRCVDEEEDGLKIDLIITDYCMPEMTGYELLKKIKKSSSLREIPVVIMSSENIVARIHRCLEEGAEDFIVKPVKLSDVKRLVECLMSSIRDVGPNHKTSSTPTAAKGPPLRNPITLGHDTNKRKQPDGSDLSPFSSSASEISGTSSSSERSSSPSPFLSPTDSTLTSPSQSPPPLPSPPPPHAVDELILDLPTRKVRQTTTTTLTSDQIQAAAVSAGAVDDDVADVPASSP